jgi:hypothetical protein
MALTRDGGKPNVGDVRAYSEPVGPKRNYPAAPGLGADNYGCCGTQGGGGAGAASSGGPGVVRQGGENKNMGTQGRR